MKERPTERISHGFGKIYHVDTGEENFTCGHFRPDAVPCSHTIAFIHALKRWPLSSTPSYSTVIAKKCTSRRNFLRWIWVP